MHVTSAVSGLTQIDVGLFDCMTIEGMNVAGSPAGFQHEVNVVTVTAAGAWPGDGFQAIIDPRVRARL
jgi:hypothetical protein